MHIKKKNEIYVIAHRGNNAEYPENTMIAFETAVEIGADMVEFDIHKTKDDEIVIIHDVDTNRVSDINLNVETSNYNDLLSVNFENGQKIPKIDELFAKLKGKIGFQIEIKQKGLTEILLEKIKKYNLESSVLISSFLHEELDKFKQLHSTIPLATLEPRGSGWIEGVSPIQLSLEHAKLRKVDCIHQFDKFVDADFIKKAHSNGFIVNPYTVDDPADWERLINIGIDGMITNNPRKLIEFLKKRK